MSKYLFGRNGPDGIHRSIERGFGRALLGSSFRAFMAGGGLGIGIGIVAQQVVGLADGWLRAATGADAAAQAAERAAEAHKKSAELAERAIKAAQVVAKGPEPQTAEQWLTGRLHPPGAADAMKARLAAQHAEIQKQREHEKVEQERAAGTSLTEDEAKSSRDATFWRLRHSIERGESSGYSIDEQKEIERQDLAKALTEKRNRILRAAIPESGSAAQLGRRSAIEARTFYGAHVAGQVGENFLPGLADMGRAAVTQIDAMSGGRLGRGVGMAGELGSKAIEGGRIAAEAAQHIADLQRDFNRRKAAWEEERQFTGGGRASDIANRGMQIQSAVFEPSPWEREGRELERQKKAIQEDTNKEIKLLNPQLKQQNDKANAAAVWGP
jgi:hypothetical protein